MEAGSLANLRAELWAIFFNCRPIVALSFGWLWPWRLVQMDEFASRYFLPRMSCRTAPLPDSIKTFRPLIQSRICVNGCHTNCLSSCWRSGDIYDGRWMVWFSAFARTAMSSDVWLAVIVMRSLAEPRATVGYRIAGTKIFFWRKALAVSSALVSSPMMKGRMALLNIEGGG